MNEVLMLAGALMLDLLAGEYPNRLHPTVWMGVLTDKLLDFAPREGTAEQFVFGCALVLAVAGLFAVPLWFGLQWLQQWNQGVYVLVGALALKPAFSIRALWAAARRHDPDCWTDLPDEALAGAEVHRLDAEHWLLIRLCTMGAYQGSGAV